METPSPVDLAADRDLLPEIYRLRAECHRLDAPEEPFATEQVWRGVVLHPPALVTRLHWVVEGGAVEGGYAGLSWIRGAAGASVEICVAPSRRRRGLGRALLETVAVYARTLGCTRLVGRHAGPGGAAFAAAVGATPGNSQIVSVLALPPEGDARPVPGYRLCSWITRAPDDLVESYARARNAISDAPHTEGADEPRWTVETVRDFEEALVLRGRRQRVTVALDGAGEVAGYTELRVSPDTGAVAGVDDTAVVAAHRGRGLATWIKRESLRLLAADRPDVALVTTANDASNAAILAVNRTLGFRPVSTWTDAVLRL